MFKECGKLALIIWFPDKRNIANHQLTKNKDKGIKAKVKTKVGCLSLGEYVNSN
jgi:hypothetical protein